MIEEPNHNENRLRIVRSVQQPTLSEDGLETAVQGDEFSSVSFSPTSKYLISEGRGPGQISKTLSREGIFPGEIEGDVITGRGDGPHKHTIIPHPSHNPSQLKRGLQWLTAKFGAAPSAPQYTRDIEAAAEKFKEALEQHFPNIRFEGYSLGARSVAVRYEGSQCLINFERFYRPGSFPYQANFRRFMQSVLKELESDQLSLRENVNWRNIENIYPVVRSPATFGERGGSLLSDPLTDGLRIYYVTEWGRSFFSYLDRPLSDRLMKNPNSIRLLAHQNLQHLALSSHFENAHAHSVPLILHRNDGLDSSALLLALRDKRAFISELTLAVPNYDQLVIAGPHCDLKKLATQVRKEHQRSDHPLSGELYRVVDGQLIALGRKSLFRVL